jgi:large subunit ribosomal protein L29
MKTAELQKLTYAELQEQLDEAKEELFNLRFQVVTNQLDNTARIQDVRHQVARIKTAMRQQEIAAWETQQEEA